MHSFIFLSSIHLIVFLNVFVCGCDKNKEDSIHTQLKEEQPLQNIDLKHIYGQDVLSDVNKNEAQHFMVEFHRLLTASNVNPSVVYEDAFNLCRDISSKLTPKASVQIFNKFIDLIINYRVEDKEYNCRQNKFSSLWFLMKSVCCYAMYIEKGNYLYWEKLITFFNKYVEEIEAISKDLDNIATKEMFDNTYFKRVKKRDYLRGLKADLSVWIRVMSDIEFLKVSGTYPEEQKAIILKKLNVLKKYAQAPL